MIKRTFFEWIAQSRRNFPVLELLQEYERHFIILSVSKKMTLILKKTKLFVQAADLWL